MTGPDILAVLLDRLSGAAPVLLTMTLSSSVAALAVMALRLVLRRAPRRYILVLWLVVIVRMVSPFGYGEGLVSLIPEPVTSGRAAEYILEGGSGGGSGPAVSSARTPDLPPNPDGALAGPMQAEDPAAPVQSAEKDPQNAVTPAGVISAVWLTGTAGMLLWSLVAWLRLRRRVAEAVMAEPDVYETDAIDVPFVLGSDIYLPTGLAAEDRRYVLLHERAHVERYDALLKGLAWIALSIHWCNPVLWLAYRLLCRDVEAACDQKVLEGFAPETRQEDTAGYAAALYHLGRRERLPQAVLPFGEENARGRIRNVLAYRKPPRWAAALLLLLCAAAAVLIGLNGPAKDVEEIGVNGADTSASRDAGDAAPWDWSSLHTLSLAESMELRENGVTHSWDVPLPGELLDGILAVLEAHPPEAWLAGDADYETWQARHGNRLLPVGDAWSIQLGGDYASLVLMVYDDGDGLLLRYWLNGTGTESDPRHAYARIPGLGRAEDFLAWCARAERWMAEDRADRLYDQFAGSDAFGGDVLSRAREIMRTGRMDQLADSPDADWSRDGRTIRIAFRPDRNAPLGLDTEAKMREALDWSLADAARLTLPFLRDTDAFVYVGRDGKEYRVESPGTNLTKEEYRALFAAAWQNRAELARGAAMGRPSEDAPEAASDQENGTVHEDRTGSVPPAASGQNGGADRKSGTGKSQTAAAAEAQQSAWSSSAPAPEEPPEETGEQIVELAARESGDWTALAEGRYQVGVFRDGESPEEPPAQSDRESMPDSLDFDFTPTDDGNNEGVE